MKSRCYVSVSIYKLKDCWWSNTYSVYVCMYSYLLKSAHKSSEQSSTLCVCMCVCAWIIQLVSIIMAILFLYLYIYILTFMPVNHHTQAYQSTLQKKPLLVNIIFVCQLWFLELIVSKNFGTAVFLSHPSISFSRNNTRTALHIHIHMYIHTCMYAYWNFDIVFVFILW